MQKEPKHPQIFMKEFFQFVGLKQPGETLHVLKVMLDHSLDVKIGTTSLGAMEWRSSYDGCLIDFPIFE